MKKGVLMLFLPIVFGIIAFFALQKLFFIIIKNKIVRLFPILITFIGSVITVIGYLRNKAASESFASDCLTPQDKDRQKHRNIHSSMMFSRPQPSKQPIQNEIDELRELVRHRSRLVEMNAKFKVSVSRIISIVFPELPKAVWSIHQKSCYAKLLLYPNAQAVAQSHLTKLCNILNENSKGKFSFFAILQKFPLFQGLQLLAFFCF